MNSNRIIHLLSWFCLFYALSIVNPLFASEILTIGAIPDQKPEKLNRLYNLLALELSSTLNVPVRYIPVTNYPAAVTAFRTKGIDLVWFGGLTGVQARLQTPGAIVLAQRDIDKTFRSVFIANTKSGIEVVSSQSDLLNLKGKRFTFGSESSTSGRLMPQHFLQQTGITMKDFKGGRAGFSGSHDATIALVQSGSYDVGALNEQVWLDNVKRGRVNGDKVVRIWRTPTYVDYHWLAQPGLDQRFGRGFTNKLKKSLLALSYNSPRHKQILDLFGARKFIPADKQQYNDIEKIGRQLGKIR